MGREIDVAETDQCCKISRQRDHEPQLSQKSQTTGNHKTDQDGLWPCQYFFLKNLKDPKWT